MLITQTVLDNTVFQISQKKMQLYFQLLYPLFGH